MISSVVKPQFRYLLITPESVSGIKLMGRDYSSIFLDMSFMQSNRVETQSDLHHS